MTSGADEAGKVSESQDKRVRAILSGTSINYPDPQDSDKRLIGWRVRYSDDIGIGAALIGVDFIRDAALSALDVHCAESQTGAVRMKLRDAAWHDYGYAVGFKAGVDCGMNGTSDEINRRLAENARDKSEARRILSTLEPKPIKETASPAVPTDVHGMADAEYLASLPGALIAMADLSKAGENIWPGKGLEANLRAAANALSDYQRLATENALLHTALAKIDAIRNSVIGFQNIGWSEHIYPLVAALEGAGYSGAGYEKARESVRTLLAAEARAEAAESKLAETVKITPTHRHKKCGTEYVLIGIGKMQAGDWQRMVPNSQDGAPGYMMMPADMHEVAIYRSAIDPGEIWVRPREEFEDGRFEALPRANGEDV